MKPRSMYGIASLPIVLLVASATLPSFDAAAGAAGRHAASVGKARAAPARGMADALYRGAVVRAAMDAPRPARSTARLRA